MDLENSGVVRKQSDILQFDRPREAEEPWKNSDNQIAMFMSNGAHNRIELSEKEFNRIGPKAAEVLKGAGVEKIEIQSNGGVDSVSATLKKPLEIAQDPDVDGNRKLKVDSTFKADISVKDDGTIVFDNIKGLKAETHVLGRWRDATVTRIEMKKGEDGQTEIKSTGEVGIFSRTQSRTKPGEIMEKAKILLDKFNEMKSQNKQGALELPHLFLG